MPHDWAKPGVSLADIAIVIVHWNVPKLLDNCLSSIETEINLSGLRTEVVVVDSASPERAYLDVLRRYEWARLIESDENLGYAGGNNLGIAKTSAPSVFILNPDTILLPGSLARLHDTMDLSPHIGLVAPLLLNPGGSVQSTGYKFPGVANVWLDFFPLHPRIYGSQVNGRVDPGNGELPYAVDYPLGAAMLLRRDALTDAGAFDTDYILNSEEIDLCQRLNEAGWTRLIEPRAKVVHAGGQSTSQRPDRAHELLWSSRARYYRRWASRWQRPLVQLGVEVGTRKESRTAGPERRAINRRIRSQFRSLR